MADQADIDGPLVDYKAKGHQVELVGKEKVEGSDAYKLKVTKKDGDVEYYFLDADSYLPVRVEGKRTIRGTEIEGESTLGDYKEAGRLPLAVLHPERRQGPPREAEHHRREGRDQPGDRRRPLQDAGPEAGRSPEEGLTPCAARDGRSSPSWPRGGWRPPPRLRGEDVKIDADTFGGLEARAIGPAAMSGRISAIDAVPGDRLTIWVGAAGGGLWKSVDGGSPSSPSSTSTASRSAP